MTKPAIKISVLLSILLTACGAQWEVQNPPIDRAQDIETLREVKLVQWPAFYKNNDADGLANFLHEDFVFIQNDGSLSTYAEEVDWVRNNPWSGDANDDFVYHIKDIQFPSDDVAMIYGEGTSTRKTEEGQPCAHSYWSSNTLKRVDARWRPTFSHVSGSQCTPLEISTAAP